MRKLVYQVCYTRYHFSFYVWLIGSVLKHCKVPKYSTKIVALLRSVNKQHSDNVRRNIIGVFKNINFSLEIEANLKEVDFLDVSLKLQNEIYCPYKTPYDRLLYIYSLSNLPLNVVEEIPNSIQESLSKNSPNKDIFNTAKCEYEDALKKSGSNVDFKYTKNQRQKTKRRSKYYLI